MSDVRNLRGEVGRMGVTALASCLLALTVFEISSSSAVVERAANDSLAPDFALRDQYGRPYRLSDRRGRVIVLAFGYTHCPDRCSMTLGSWKRAKAAIGARAEDVDFVYITVDPARDTEEAFRERLAAFGGDFFGLSGTPDELAEVYRRYGVEHEATPVSDAQLGYLVTHPFGTIVVDRSGRIAAELEYLSFAGDEEPLVAAIERALGRA
jgi:protein SCO1/2